jgi:hypothetical protein
MADRRIDRDTTKKLREVADRLLTDLLTDPDVARVVAEPLIEDAINSGDLIPRERLMLAQGFELAPMGRLADLEDAVITAMEALAADEPNAKKAMKALAAVLPPPEEEPEPGPDEVGEGEAEGEEPDVEPEPEGDDDELVVPELEVVEDEVEVDTRPTAPQPPERERPTEDEPGACTVCGEDLEYPVALRSWTRFRVLLCDADYMAHKQPVAPAE